MAARLAGPRIPPGGVVVVARSSTTHSSSALPSGRGRPAPYRTPLFSGLLEGIGGDLSPDRDPAGFRERVQVGGAAEACPGAGGEDPAERRVRRVVHGLVVDVDDPGRD